MSIASFLKGSIRLSLRGTDLEAFLNACAKRGVAFHGLRRTEDYTATLSVFPRDLEKAREAAKRAQCELTVISKRGLPALFSGTKKRLALLLGLSLCLSLLAASSLFIWDIEVTGCETLTEGEVLRALDRCGVSIGSFWPPFVSDNIRSRMIAELPQLQWMTVKVFASRAEVLVREKTEAPALVQEKLPTKVVAKRDGFLRSASVLRGVPLVSAGQSVCAGETLVTGISNSLCGGTRFLHAMAEIRAETRHQITVLSPAEREQKIVSEKETQKISMNFGTKRRFFSKSYGFVGADCDKIKTEIPFAVKGLFSLPLSLTKTGVQSYTLTTEPVDWDSTVQRLTQTALETLTAQLGADGEILQSEASAAEENGWIAVTLTAVCLENIAEEQPLTQEEMEAALAAGEDDTAE